MWRIFSLAILALIPVGRVGAQDKRSLIVEVLQTAGDYGDIAPVWGIVQKDGDIYRFVPSVAPLKEKYRISDRYGYRTHPISGERQFHAGLDMAAVYAATVHAAASGTVTFAGETPGYGKTVVVTHRFGFQPRSELLTLIYTRKGAYIRSFAYYLTYYILRVGAQYFDFHTRSRLSAGTRLEIFPIFITDNRSTLSHAISHGIGEIYTFQELLYFLIEGGTSYNNFVEITSEGIYHLFADCGFDFIIDDRNFQ